MKKLLKKILPNYLQLNYQLRKKLMILSNGKILSGPFKEMQYINSSVGSAFTPKILGVYELELHQIIGELCKKRFNKIVDVGAAEGYYAVGLAVLNPQSQIIAFEMQEKGRELIKTLAKANKVEDRVVIYGTCDRQSLSQNLDAQDCLIIMDVEGAEMDLLSLDVSDKLLKSHILVEVHDAVSPEISKSIKKRFEASHQISTIEQKRRKKEDMPVSIDLSSFQKIIYSLTTQNYDDNILQLMNEYRSKETHWLYMQPN